MDFELEELMKTFQNLQNEEVKLKLSERNCVELVQKIISKKLIENLYFTMDGKEYVTETQLDKELIEICQRGRIETNELQNLLNIELSVIQKRLQLILKDNKEMQMIGTEIITNKFLDSVVSEILEMLKQAGDLILTDLSERFSLPTKKIHFILKNCGRLEEEVRLEDNIIFNSIFIEREKSKIRGCFSAITKPTQVSEMQKKYNFHPRLFQTCLQEMIKEGRLYGNLIGDTYIPTIFSKKRDEWIKNFFVQNGFISYTTLNKMNMENPKVRKRNWIVNFHANWIF